MEHITFNKKENGFTIIEIIISIFILCVGIIGVYSAFSAVSILTADSADRLVAAYLAQEGIEVVRNIRDSNWLTCENGLWCTWSSFITDTGEICLNCPMDCTAGCEISYNLFLPMLMPWPSATDGDYLKKNDNGFYYYDSATGGGTADDPKTKFKRKVTITLLNPNVMKVVSEVYWDQKASLLGDGCKAAQTGCTSNTVKAEETLYNWF